MRRLLPQLATTLLLCGLTTALPAQEGRARVQTSDAPAQEPRPEAQPLRVPAVDPALEAVLVQWHEKTKDIKKLHGDHRRWSYEKVFGVAMVSSGEFYFEAPDKGRIDITPDEDKLFKELDADPAADGVQITGVDQQRYTLKPDQPEKWVCDGARIVKIDDAAKTYEVLPIPAEHQGANIMDGPMPFLFGLPPDKAKKRYNMKLVLKTKEEIRLSVKPKMQKDAASWQQATVILRADTFLPSAVMLLDPSGNRTTVFSFGKPEINPVSLGEIIGISDPFRPNLFGYKQVQSAAPAPLQLNGKPITGVPSVIGMHHNQAKTVLGQRGYTNLRVLRDTAPSDPKLRFHVKSQDPPPDAAAPPDQTVQLVLYVTQEDIEAYEKKNAAEKR